MTAQIEQLGAEAEIGEAARAFVESDIGRCVLGMAEQEIAEAQVALETVDPTDFVRIRELQNKARLGRIFNQWLCELIDRGTAAIEIFKHQNRD